MREHTNLACVCAQRETQGVCSALGDALGEVLLLRLLGLLHLLGIEVALLEARLQTSP